MAATIYIPEEVTTFSSVWQPGLTVPLPSLTITGGYSPDSGTNIIATITPSSSDFTTISVDFILNGDDVYDGSYGVYWADSPFQTSGTVILDSSDLPDSGQLEFATSSVFPASVTITLSNPVGATLGTPSNDLLIWSSV